MNEFRINAVMGNLCVLTAIICVTIIVTTFMREAQKTERTKFIAGYEQVVDTTLSTHPAVMVPVWKKAKR